MNIKPASVEEFNRADEDPLRRRAREVAAEALLSVRRTPADELIGVLRRRWKLVTVIAALTLLAAAIYVTTQPKLYRASVIAAVATASEGLQPNEVLRGVDTLERRTVVATITALASTPFTRKLALGGKADEDYNFHATVLPNTNLFRLDVEGRNPQLVLQIANRMPGLLETQSRALFKYYRVATVSPAILPEKPFSPRTSRTIAAALIVGLFLGVAAAWVVDRLKFGIERS